VKDRRPYEVSRGPSLIQLKVENIHDQKRPSVQKDYMSTDQNVLATGRRRGQAAFQVVGTMVELLAQTGWKRAAHNKLSLQARRQLITFGEAGRKVVMVLTVPATHLVTIMVTIAVTIPVVITVSAFAMVTGLMTIPVVITVSVFIMVTVVSKGETGEGEYRCCARI
jgi:hypothetical protein